MESFAAIDQIPQFVTISIKMAPLFLLIIVGVSGVYCDSHSLQYYYTVVSAPGFGLPEFSTVGYVDEKQIDKYHSETESDRAMVPWMKTVEGDPGYWDRQTQSFKVSEAIYKHNVKIAMSRFNQTRGFHILQWMYGCELNDDGSTWEFNQHGYDGRDFISLDNERGVYVPLMNEAQITTQRWNSPEDGTTERWKNILETECIEYLKKHIRAGRNELEKRVPPQVKVSGQQSVKVTKLHCQVYGFYPRDVHVKWVKNGIDDVYSEEAKAILPNPDGTYQIRVTVEVTPKKGDSYSCHVDHSSLEETLVLLWEPPQHSPLLIVIGVIAVIAVIAAAVIGFIVYKKRSGNRTYGPALTSDKDSSTS